MSKSQATSDTLTIAKPNDESYKKSYNLTESSYDPYFVKSNLYKIQNEWRLIVDGSYGNLPTCSNGSYNIELGKLEWTYLIETDVFLETFIIEDDEI